MGRAHSAHRPSVFGLATYLRGIGGLLVQPFGIKSCEVIRYVGIVDRVREVIAFPAHRSQ